jgi:hypothetical protein
MLNFSLKRRFGILLLLYPILSVNLGALWWGTFQFVELLTGQNLPLPQEAPTEHYVVASVAVAFVSAALLLFALTIIFFPVAFLWGCMHIWLRSDQLSILGRRDPRYKWLLLFLTLWATSAIVFWFDPWGFQELLLSILND